jgi:hypothetical protein
MSPSTRTAGRNAVKIVVFGPGRRTGALRDGMVVDLCGAFAKYAAEKLGEAHPIALAQTRLSRDLTLYPGDIISGGTAAGTAADSSPLLADGTSAPERYLKPGDTVEIRSPAIGSLHASIVSKNANA